MKKRNIMWFLVIGPKSELPKRGGAYALNAIKNCRDMKLLPNCTG
jgi:hypothetical protein